MVQFNPAWADAIAAVESGGRYGILGPVTRSGDRAYGKYQVMGANIGPWTKEVLGKELTPQQFLADPAAQDAVFKAKFGQAVAKYGNPQDAASVWFSGRPMAKAGSASDGFSTVPQYVAKFNAALGPQTDSLPSASLPSSSIPSAPMAAPGFPMGIPPVESAQLAQGPPPQPSPQIEPMQFGPPLQLPQPEPPLARPIELSGLAKLLQSAPPQVRGLILGRST